MSTHAEEQELHNAASGIFDMLPEDPFGEGEGEEAIGKREEREPAAPKPDAKPEHEPEVDEDAANAIRGEQDDPEVEAEDEDADDEDADYDEGEDDDDEEDAPEPKETSRFTVKVDGEEQEVPLDELLAGYSRTASWTKKSQQLSSERKAFEAERQQVQQERAALAARLKEAEVAIGSQMPDEPSPDDPQAWIRYKQEMQRLENVQRERAALEGKMREDWQREQDARVQAENERLAELIPEWQDDEVAMTEKKSLAKYAVGVCGYDVEDVSNIVDHRTVLLLRKAKAYDELKDKTTEAKSRTKTGKTLKPGRPSRKSSTTRKKQRKSRSQRDQLRDTGSVKDAAAYIHDTLLADVE